MSTFKCKMCGGALEIENNETIATCEYCGTQQTLPKLDDDRRANLYDRANHFRRNNEFDKAMGIYEQILNEDKSDAEAYWSLVLCRYGIEYVEDPTNHKRVPTVNRAQFTSVFDDDNYKSALEYADGYQRMIYEQEAKTINEIQKGILAISRKEEPFDVFICYKETDNNGRRTPDSVLANDLYHQLTQEGFKVFFARITLEDKLGSAYEPYIFAALNSAKVMVVLGTKPEFFNAVWVKNEWSRYLSLIKQGQKKLLIPAYKDMDPYDLPEEFSHLQAQDMSKLGFMQDMIRGIKKITQAAVPTAKVVKETVIAAGNANTAPLLKRTFMFLEDGDWKSADEYCEKVLDIDPENAQAYLGKLLAELRVCTYEKLKDLETPFDDKSNYKKVIRFADTALKKALADTILRIEERNNERKYENIYKYAMLQFNKKKYCSATRLFKKIANYKDSIEFLDRSIREMDGLDIKQIATVNLNGKWGYIDETGEMVIRPQFDGASNFPENGLALVKVNGEWGYIDETGEMVIEPQFDNPEDFSENGLAPVEANDKYGYIDETGKMVIEPQFDDAWFFSENGLAAVKINDKWGYIDETGEMVIEPQFNSAWGFSKNGLAFVEVNDKYGCIDETGEMVIEPQFNNVWHFSKNGLARVKVNGKWGYIDETGKMVIEPQFDSAWGFSENGLARVEVNDKLGYIDETGKMVIEPQFDSARDFSENGLARVKVNDKLGYIDETGKMVIEPQFDSAWDFSENGLACVKVNGKWGYIDETGEMVIEPQFDGVYPFTVFSQKDIVEHAASITERKKRMEEKRRLEEERRLEEQRRLEEERRLEEQRRLEEERRLEEQKHLEEQKRATVAKLQQEQAVLEAELVGLKGFFTGKRRKQIEARLAEIQRELVRNRG